MTRMSLCMTAPMTAILDLPLAARRSAKERKAGLQRHGGESWHVKSGAEAEHCRFWRGWSCRARKSRSSGWAGVRPARAASWLACGEAGEVGEFAEQGIGGDEADAWDGVEQVDLLLEARMLAGMVVDAAASSSAICRSRKAICCAMLRRAPGAEHARSSSRLRSCWRICLSVASRRARSCSSRCSGGGGDHSSGCWVAQKSAISRASWRSVLLRCSLLWP